jgi:hypothetical protein
LSDWQHAGCHGDEYDDALHFTGLYTCGPGHGDDGIDDGIDRQFAGGARW